MTSATDTLRATLDETAFNALRGLAVSPKPMSGRMMANKLGVSPTTATAALGKLRDAGFAMSSREGRADRWRLNTDNVLVRSWLEGTRDEPKAPEAVGGMSPYPTGGGGVTFERKVAVQYLAHLLVGDGAVELGDGRHVVSVEFQQAPEHSVDDLVIRAARGDDLEPSLVLAAGVRRAPDLVQSDESTRKLIRAFVREIINAPADGPEHRCALVVAGAQEHAKQLAMLADFAYKQMEASRFFRLVRKPGKFDDGVRGRLQQVEGLVKLALADLGVADPGAQLVEERVWGLLSRLTVLMPRLETPDEADWAAVTNSLLPVARGGDLLGATQLRDRLVALADEYPPKAATVNLSMLRRDAHPAIDSAKRRHRQGWQALGHLHARATAVRDHIASEDGRRTLQLDRSQAAAELLALAGPSAAAVVAHGDSGVGKSALAVGAAIDAASPADGATQALCMNLRQLPATSLELEAHLGAPLATLLAELSAPLRLMVIDGADAVSEGSETVFRYLADAAQQADVTIIAVTANDARQLVRDTVAEYCGANVAEYLVPPLTDSEVEETIAVFGELAALGANPRSRELLRRPVVVDLLIRGGVTGTPLSDADAMEQVWAGLVCRQGRSDRGTPDARQLALLGLADLALRGGDPLEVLSRIDPAALEGLRRDGLLQTSPDDPFKIGPEFAHDEVRRYAIARLLLSAPGGLTSKLVAAGVPRWSLGAARLACQALLARPDIPANPLHGRLARLQEAFDELVASGHGERWGDVPGEALLTLGDSGPVLRDAWAELRATSGSGLRRLCRLVEQRLRDDRGVVRSVAVEPLLALLLDDETSFIADDYLQDLVRAWLRALVIADTPAGYPLRVRLRDRLAAACAAADRRLEAEHEAASAARAALSPEEIEEERQFEEHQNAFLARIGHSRARRRARSEVPCEITDEAMVELLALLGPDLGDQGEGILRRVARDAPSRLHPAVEELATGRALASYRRGFLAELTEAYYLDEEEDGSGFHEDGIRRHQSRSFGVAPLAAWYRGPFMALFQTDFRNGVAVLNRMLNHAALARARSLASLDHCGGPVDDSELDAYRTELGITGTSVVYVGDDHVWTWYRGTGVGPYPCMSALEALERVCDQLVAAGVPLANIVAVLLDGCENLAMPGLAVGLLVRHLEDAGQLLDRYLTEPDIWHLEFTRLTHENSGLAASSDGIVQAERRRWSLREAGMLLVLNADDTRADELRAIGGQLVAAARRVATEALGEGADEATAERLLATVRSWASGLDRATYEARQAEGGIYVQSTPPDDVAAALRHNSEELARAGEATRLIVRYHIEPLKGTALPLSAEDLAADLAVAEQLLDSPPDYSPGDPWDAPAAVAATALEASIISGTELPAEALRFAAETMIRIGEGAVEPHPYDNEGSYFEQGADRSAARALPLLLLPDAAALRANLDGGDGSEAYAHAAAAAGSVAQSLPDEVRLNLAHGLDRVWEASCTKDGTCHHGTAFQLAVETMRDCVFGPWNPDTGRRQLIKLADPVDRTLAGTADNEIHFSRLDAAIRALAPAAQAGVCVSGCARELLTVLLAAHRRSLLSYDDDMDHRGTHALIAARALLTIAADGDDALVHEHIDAYADNPALLLNFLRALSAAGEETAGRAATAARIWPSIVAHVINLHETGHSPFHDRYHGNYALASLMPNAAGEVAYLYRELAGDPVVWWQPLSWQDTVEQWLPLAQGDPTCVDHLIGFVRPLPPEDQARTGLPWIARLVLASPGGVANRTFLLSTWLVEIRQPASDADLLPDWQRVVDALVVAGVARLAPYSE